MEIAAGLFGLVFFGVAIAALVFWIITLVEVAKIPDFQYRAGGAEKVTWVLLVALLGAIGALVWRLGSTRDRVLAAAGGYGGQQPAATVPPGWYPDPDGSGRQRWWDGVQWTEHST